MALCAPKPSSISRSLLLRLLAPNPWTILALLHDNPRLQHAIFSFGPQALSILETAVDVGLGLPFLFRLSSQNARSWSRKNEHSNNDQQFPCHNFPSYKMLPLSNFGGLADH